MESTQSENLHVQIVHSGTTRLVHAPQSAGVDRLFTGGDDSLVRILPTLPVPGVEPLLIEDATEAVTCMDADAKFLITGSEDGHVRLYRHHPTDSEGKSLSPTLLQTLLRREVLPIRCVAIERSVKPGKTPRVAVCSDELIVKIVDAADPVRLQLLVGHTRGLRSASWSPVAPILITCCTDGVARVTDLSGVAPEHVASITDILPATRAESEEASIACWHPSGTWFVLPSKAHELVIISAQNNSTAWQRTGSFTASSSGSVPAPSGNINALAFSPNGRYLAVGTQDGQITIWETSSRQAIRARRADGLVTGISWHPSKDALAWTDSEGTLARWSDVLGATNQSPYEHIKFDTRQAARGSKDQINNIFAGTGLSDDEDEDETGGAQDSVDDLDDFVIDDNGYGRHAGDRSRSDYRPRFNGRESSSGLMVAATKPQPAFQPTSTPMKAKRCYLAYNLLGNVTAVEQDSHQSISFESFDISARRNWRFSDMNSLSMASLAKQGVLLAGKQAGEHSSSVHFKPFTAGIAALSSEWTVNLDHGEDVEAIALGGSGLRTISDDEYAEEDAANSGHGIAVIATSKGYLRFLTTSGMQIYLWALGHQVVTLAAGARTLLVVYRNTGSASGGYQDLHYKLIDLVNFDLLQEDALPLGKDTYLRWVGFNDQHQPALYDSNGTLFVLDRAHRCRQGRWVPTLDTKQVSQTDAETGERTTSTLAYWPVALTCKKLMVLFLKGGRTHPEVDGTRHLMQELDLQLPLLPREAGTGPLEEKSLKDSMLAMTARDVKSAGIEASAAMDDEPLDPTTLEMSSDKALLQLIQLACKADKHARALDAARALHSTRTLEAALKIAAFFHLSSLAERMMALKDGLEGRPDRVEDESRRWCDPSVRGGPSYSNSILLDIMTRHHDRSADSGGVSAAAVRKRASAALGQGFAPPPMSSPAPIAMSSPLRVDDVGKENVYRGSVGQKRKSPEQESLGEYDSYMDHDNESSRDFGRSPSINAGQSATLMMPTAAKVAKSSNPFARTSSANVAAAAAGRDKQMHKSTSFFERIEPFEKESMTKSSASLSASRQAKLSGFAFKKDQPAPAAPTTAASELGETLDLDMGTEDTQDESLQAMLSHAQEVDPAPAL